MIDTAQNIIHIICENQLLAAYNLDGDPCSVSVSLYFYDTFGRRVTKAAATGVGSTTGEVTESHLYDGFQAIAEYGEDDRIKRRFIYAAGIDEPVCMVVEPDHQGYYGLEEYSNIAYSWLCDPNDTCFDPQANYYADSYIDIEDVLIFASDYYLDDRPPLEDSKYYGYVFDGMSNVVALTYCNDPNQTGDPNEMPYFAETYTYDPFGEVTIYDANGIEQTESQIGNPYMFTARRYDNESGLYYYRYRMYSPELGRFMQTDPIGYYDSMNLYQYCVNNPVNYIDPWGLWTFEGTIAKGPGISFEIGKNSGQWSFGIQVGVGVGTSFGLDFEDTGRQRKGLTGTSGINAAYGNGILGASGGLNLDSSRKKGELDLGTSLDTPVFKIGPTWDIGYGPPHINTETSIRKDTFNLLKGKITAGFSVFAGGGVKYVW